MQNPTVIFNATIGANLITVIDVMGTCHLQVYTLSNGRTLLDHSETFSDGDNAIAHAEQYRKTLAR